MIVIPARVISLRHHRPCAGDPDYPGRRSFTVSRWPGGALYVGVTNDLARRVWEHKTGRGSDHARLYKIDRLVYYESYPSIADAIQRETSIKRWPRAWKTNLILEMNPTWRDLYEELNA